MTTLELDILCITERLVKHKKYLETTLKYNYV